MSRPPAPALPTQTVRLELRREAQQPPCWSVRFELSAGMAWLRLPGGWSRTAESAARSGAASGLRAAELAQVDLMLRHEAGSWTPWRVIEGIDPMSLPVGRWVTLEPTTEADRQDALFEELVVIDGMEDPDDWSEEMGELEESITELGRPDLPPAPGDAAAPEAPASLVRSLVLRIRQQERLITQLKEQVIRLGAVPVGD
jgi:hypothetical protein